MQDVGGLFLHGQPFAEQEGVERQESVFQQLLAPQHFLLPFLGVLVLQFVFGAYQSLWQQLE